MGRFLFLLGRRLDRARARLRAAREGSRLARMTARSATSDPAPPATGGTLAILSHQDDDLLFMSTSLERDVAEGRALTTIFLTAGDDDDDEWYWRAREAGVRAAYSELFGVADRWIESVRRVAGQPITQVVLAEHPSTALLFVRLPDGGIEGAGGERAGGASLRKLWEGRIATISAIDGSATHSLATLHAVLRELLDVHRPDRITTLDHHGDFGDGDHSDHHVAAFLAERVYGEYVAGSSGVVGSSGASTAELAAYLGYRIADLPSNLTPAQIAVKEHAFFTYALSDYKTCSTVAACSVRPEGAWLSREYRSEAAPGG